MRCCLLSKNHAYSFYRLLLAGLVSYRIFWGGGVCARTTPTFIDKHFAYSNSKMSGEGNSSWRENGEIRNSMNDNY